MLDLKELANELDDLQAIEEDRPHDVDEAARVRALEELETYVGDLHVAANRGYSLLVHEEAKRQILDSCDDDLPSWAVGYIDWDGVADDRLTDWTVIDFDGETYYTTDV